MCFLWLDKRLEEVISVKLKWWISYQWGLVFLCLSLFEGSKALEKVLILLFRYRCLL